MQSLLGHPYALPAGGGLVALLGLLALMRIRRQRQEAALAASGDGPSEYMAAEGQTVDTREDAPVSSMMYSPSQLDAGGDVLDDDAVGGRVVALVDHLDGVVVLDLAAADRATQRDA